jgi:Na+/H+ antiporter NhaD/arsenite permease-like protein
MADNPQALMAVSLGLISVCVIVIVLFIIFVHTMPGRIAKKRDNPQAEAIEILSLLGLLIFPLWMAALVWAYVRPFTVPVKVLDRPTESGSGAEAARAVAAESVESNGEA